jgi:hypothetical protein
MLGNYQVAAQLVVSRIVLSSTVSLLVRYFHLNASSDV